MFGKESPRNSSREIVCAIIWLLVSHKTWIHHLLTQDMLTCTIYMWSEGCYMNANMQASWSHYEKCIWTLSNKKKWYHHKYATRIQFTTQKTCVEWTPLSIRLHNQHMVSMQCYLTWTVHSQVMFDTRATGTNLSHILEYILESISGSRHKITPGCIYQQQRSTNGTQKISTSKNLAR